MLEIAQQTRELAHLLDAKLIINNRIAYGEVYDRKINR